MIWYASCICLIYVFLFGCISSSQTYQIPQADYPDQMPYGDSMTRYRRIRQRQYISNRNVEIEKNWPADIRKLWDSGQVSGIDVDYLGNVHVFRRFNHKWTKYSFNNWMQYKNVKDGPINKDAVAVLNKTGHIIRSWGKNIFYMPHGLTVDEELSTWVTDVALHQVMKFPKGANSPSLVLGNKFTPGRGVYSFCMPTDVMVDSEGNIYISDGYCNSRILMFHSNGEFKKQWGSEDRKLLYIPHSLTLMKRRSGDILCVADRENQRVICYQGMNNDAPWAVRSFNTRGKIYAIDHVRNTVYGATYDGIKSSGFSFDTLKWAYTGQWNLSEGIVVHDMAMDESALVIANINRSNGKAPVYKVDLDVTNQV